MLKRIPLLALLVVLSVISAQALTKVQGIVERGGQAVVGNRQVVINYPLSTVTVYVTGTLTLVSIYSNDSGSVKSNPFTAGSDASYFFYVAPGRYDIKFSGTGVSTPWTISDIQVGQAEVTVTEANLSFSDITTANASTLKHGLLPKLDGNASNCLRGDGTWTSCAGSGGGDVSSNTSTSVDGEAALFSGTGGKTIKRATGTGVAKLSSGVLAAGTVSLNTEVSGTLQAAQFPILTGNVTTSGASLVTTIANGVVTNAMLAGSIATSKMASRSGDGTIVGTVTGTTPVGKCLEWDANGNIVTAVSNAACGSGGGGGSPGGVGAELQYRGGSSTFSAAVFSASANGLQLNATPTASASKAYLHTSTANLSSGSANGTMIGANPAAFTGDFFNFQINNSTLAKLTNAGALTVASVNGIPDFLSVSTAQTVTGKKTFTPSATTAMLNIGQYAGTPSTPTAGDKYLNISDNKEYTYSNGNWREVFLAGVSGPVSNVNGGTGSTLGADTVLASSSGVDLNTATPTTLYTCPAATTCVITKVLITAASTSLTTASISFGWNSATFNDVIADATHTELTTSTLYTILDAKAGAKLGAATDTFKVLANVLQGSAATVTIKTFGYLY